MGGEDPLQGLSEFADAADGFEVTAWLQVSPRFNYLVGWFVRNCSARLPSEAPEDVVRDFLTLQIPRIHATWRSRGRRSFRAYFWRSYRHFVAERCERHCRERDRNGLTLVEEQVALEHFRAIPDHEISAILQQRQGLLTECLSYLDPKYSRVLRLHFSDFTADEIAIRTGQPAATIRTWLSRGRQKLHEHVYMRLLRFTAAHIRNWSAICRELHLGHSAPAGSARRRVWERLDPTSQSLVARGADRSSIDMQTQVGVIECLNGLLARSDLFDLDSVSQLAATDRALQSIVVSGVLQSSTFAIPINRVILEHILSPHVVEDSWVRQGIRTWTSSQ